MVALPAFLLFLNPSHHSFVSWKEVNHWDLNLHVKMAAVCMCTVRNKSLPPPAGGCGLPVWWPRLVCLNAIINHIYLRRTLMSIPVIWSWQSITPFITAIGRYGDSVISALQSRWPVSHRPHTLQEGFGFPGSLLAEGCEKNTERRGEQRTFHVGCAIDDWHFFPPMKQQSVPLLNGWMQNSLYWHRLFPFSNWNETK